MPRIQPQEPDFDPESFSEADLERAYREGLRLFDAGEYHPAHEQFERCWLAREGADEGFFKGLIQAAIAMHHFERGNVEGARKLHVGARRLLGPFLPSHRGLDVAGFLSELQRRM